MEERTPENVMTLAEEVRQLRSKIKRLNKENKRLQEERDFRCEKPCEKCVTDITEIKAENGKIVFSLPLE